MIFIRETVEKDLASVIGLLQCLSSFVPKKNDYPYIWEAFNEQKNLHSVVATLEEEVVNKMIHDKNLKNSINDTPSYKPVTMPSHNASLVTPKDHEHVGEPRPAPRRTKLYN